VFEAEINSSAERLFNWLLSIRQRGVLQDLSFSIGTYILTKITIRI
jgi:hypothetical protein